MVLKDYNNESQILSTVLNYFSVTASNLWSLLNVDCTECWMSFWYISWTAYYFSTTNFWNFWIVLLIANTKTTHQIWLGAPQGLGLHSYAWLDRHPGVFCDKVETLHETTCVDGGRRPGKLCHGGKICWPAIINSFLECRVKWSCCVVQQYGGLSVSGWKLHLHANSGERTEPVSWKFVFLSVGCCLVRRFAGPAMRIIRERSLGEETFVVS